MLVIFWLNKGLLVVRFRIIRFTVCALLIFHAFSVLAQNINSNEIARKFDEFGYIHYGDASARMDNVAIFLMNDPSLKTYIIAYAGRDDYPGISHRYAYRLKNYLVSRQIDANRVIAVDGGRREKQYTEIWFVPRGAASPLSTLALTSESIFIAQSTKFDEYPIALSNDEDFDSWDGRYEDAAARLDGVAAIMRKQPDLRVYIIARAQGVYVYKAMSKQLRGGQRWYKRVLSRRWSDPLGTDRKIASKEKSYLVTKQGINESRIIIMGAGYNELPKSKPELLTPEALVTHGYVPRTIELWLVPPGAATPMLNKALKGS
jgi:hypothetical protein